MHYFGIQLPECDCFGIHLPGMPLLWNSAFQNNPALVFNADKIHAALNKIRQLGSLEQSLAQKGQVCQITNYFLLFFRICLI